MTAKHRNKAASAGGKDKPSASYAEIKRFLVNHNASRHLALYLKTSDGLLIWRAYQEYRRADLPVPENLLKKFDQFAERLGRAGSAREVAKALEMGSSDGPAGATLTKAREHQRNIVEQVHVAKQVAWAQTPHLRTVDAIYTEVAERFGTTKGCVKKTYREWMRRAGLGGAPKK